VKVELFASILIRYSQQCETNEKHKDEQLVTRYYKATTDQALAALQEIFSDKRQFMIKSDSKERGEMFVENLFSPKTYIVATCITVRPFETAIDFNVSSDKSSLLGIYPVLKGQILLAFKQLDEKLTHVGTGKTALFT
jgi:hypothetical protein